ncbi:hypothetical protein [Pectobacterium versatile]|uniref:hypothetical protein n=1 Tax=Pectobacterium versatile TaxID=2488639 RepID=UPI0037F1F552
MHNQTPAINATLHVTPDFTGRVLVYVENGKTTSDRALSESEHIGDLNAFLDLARMAGYQIQAPDMPVSHKGEHHA